MAVNTYPLIWPSPPETIFQNLFYPDSIPNIIVPDNQSPFQKCNRDYNDDFTFIPDNMFYNATLPHSEVLETSARTTQFGKKCELDRDDGTSTIVGEMRNEQTMKQNYNILEIDTNDFNIEDYI